MNLFFRKKPKPKPLIAFYFHFSPELQFEPQSDQIIYIESTYNEAINKFIRTHLQEIDQFFAKKGQHFFYLPRLVQLLQQEETLSYNFPGKVIDKQALTISPNDYSFLLDYAVSEQPLTHGLIRYKKFEEPKPTFSYLELTEDKIWDQLNEYSSRISESIYFSLGGPETPDDTADFHFHFKAQELMTEIRDRVTQLRIAGVGEALIRELLESPPVLSPMVITSDYRILLTDYNIEIDLYPLPKALYLLFINHPEGIILKHLSDYRDELLDIYLRVNTGADRATAIVSIRDLTDPTKNSVNEKCSRIREAFVKLITPSIADYYLITGKRGEPKKIQLDRKLIKIE